MFRHLTILLFLLFGLSVRSICAENADLQPLLQALGSSNLFNSANPPMSITGEITLYRLAKGDEKGTYKITWISPKDWRRDIKTPMFDSSEGVMEGTGWEKNNFGWLPLRITQLEDVRQAYAQI